MGDIWFLAPVMVYIILHISGKEAGDLSVKYWLGTAIARHKIQVDLLYAFQGKKRVTWIHWGWFCSAAGIGVG